MTDNFFPHDYSFFPVEDMMLYNRPEKYGPPEIEPGEITYHPERDFLGEGSFGKVFKGKCRETQVAVKIPKKQQLTPNEYDAFKKEVNTMSKIFHPNIVLFMGACTQPGKFVIVTELLSKDLEKLLRTEGKIITPFVRMKMAKDAAKGMSWLHGINNIIHRDLKPANLLVDLNLNVKVSDFGFSESLKGGSSMKDNPNSGFRGTPIWMAPEVMAKMDFDKSIDVYAFGLIIWELYTLEEPFSEFTEYEEFFTAIVLNGKRPDIPPKCPPSLRSLMQRSWHADRKIRPSFDDTVAELNKILVDLSIHSAAGADFWKNYFSKNKELLESVSWEDFKTALLKETKVKDSSIFNSLREFLVNDNKVTLSLFDKCILWFGYFFNQERVHQVMDEVNKLINQPWFHGTIDRQEADGRLADRDDGTYLLRLSATQRDHPYSISLTGQHHLRIKTTMDSLGYMKFSLANQTRQFQSIFELMDHTKDTLSLKKACPKEPAPSPYCNIQF